MSSDSQFQQPIGGTFTAAAQTLDLSSPNSSTSIIQIVGTWVGTLVAEGSNDNSTWSILGLLNNTTKLFALNITVNGVYFCNTNGFQYLRLRSSVWTSGTANSYIYGSDAASILTAEAYIRGATDGSLISNTGTRLNVDANLNSGQLVPTITNKFRVVSNIGNINLNNSTYTTLYSRSGTGLFFGFQAAFDGSTVLIRLTIDSGQVFDLLLDDVRQFQFNDTTTTRTQMGGFLTTIGNVFDFSSKFAIPYSSSVLIEAKASTGAARKNQNYIIFETQDT